MSGSVSTAFFAAAGDAGAAAQFHRVGLVAIRQQVDHHVVGGEGLAGPRHARLPLEAHVAVAARFAEGAGGDIHVAGGVVAGDVRHGLIEHPHGVALFVVGEAHALAVGLAPLEGHRPRRPQDALTLRVAGGRRVRHEAVGGGQPHVALHVDRPLPGADRALLRRDDEAAVAGPGDGRGHVVRDRPAVGVLHLLAELEREVLALAARLLGLAGRDPRRDRGRERRHRRRRRRRAAATREPIGAHRDPQGHGSRNQAPSALP